MTHSRYLFRWLQAACLSLSHALGAAESPWERVPMDVPATAFGPGSRCQFSDYFKGESRVRVTSIDEIVDWLGTCEYVTDADQFHEPDVWQPPCAFEGRQRGDCEDFALWAWRKLAEIGVDAEFYVGRVNCGGEPAAARQHAWVVYRGSREDILFEPAARDPEQMMRPLSAVKGDYVPHFAIDRRFVTSAFVGCLSDCRESAVT
ncbi:MAG: transglutaminase family protein cysteine peptidase [Acidobacteria bacterium]|nr:transglutaminase family protein cysteine peptidase [Acidobacteriota bacterium]